MNRHGHNFLLTILLAAPELLLAQIPVFDDPKPPEKRISIGYNTFGEFYVGGELPRKSFHRLSLQAGYQIALTSGMSYAWGPFSTTTPWLTNNCEGVRFRVGYQFIDMRNDKRIMLFIETHQLQSNPYINQDFSGSNLVASLYFTETHQKYGARFMTASPIGQSRTVYFTFSIGVFYTMAHRTYISASNGIALPPDTDTTFTTPQITAGLQFMLF